LAAPADRLKRLESQEARTLGGLKAMRLEGKEVEGRKAKGIEHGA